MKNRIGTKTRIFMVCMNSVYLFKKCLVLLPAITNSHTWPLKNNLKKYLIYSTKSMVILKVDLF